MVLTQEFADNLKSQPLEVQSMEILKILDSDVDIIKNRDILMQFEDILRDLQVANKSVDNTTGDFFQIRVDYVVKMRKERKEKENL